MPWIEAAQPFSYPSPGVARWTRDYPPGAHNVTDACAAYAVGRGVANALPAPPEGREAEPVLEDYVAHPEALVSAPPQV